MVWLNYGDFKDLPRRQLLIKYYVVKHLIVLKKDEIYPKYDKYQRELAWMI